MDRFYLENATLYQKLVNDLDVRRPAAHFSRHNGVLPKEDLIVREQYNPDVIVGVRIRPMLDDDLAAGFPCAVYPRDMRTEDQQIVDVHELYHHPRQKPFLKSSKHQVDRLFGSTTTTKEIYTDLISDLVDFARRGGIGTLFAYGQTGSGKTFTISQLQRLVASSLMEEVLLSEREIYITIFDLAGNSAFDLLDSRKPFSVLQDSAGNTRLSGAKEHRVSTEDEILQFIGEAALYRQTASTVKNDASSRSHSICRIRIRGLSSSDKNDGLLYLVDLAGSEAARDVAEHGPDRMRETKEINMSLSVLKDCVRGRAEFERLQLNEARARSKKIHLPIRQSTLTRVLKHVFDPQGDRECKTVVLACVNPNLADVGPTKNTLRYAEMLRAPVTTGRR